MILLKLDLYESFELHERPYTYQATGYTITCA